MITEQTAHARAVAAQLSHCIERALHLTDDRRRFIIGGDTDELALLKAVAGDLWKPVPDCFEPKALEGPHIVGSFDGVPVAEFKDSTPDRRAGFALFLNGSHIGGVITNPKLGAPHSYHKEGDPPQMIVHASVSTDPRVYLAPSKENETARDMVGRLLDAMIGVAADALRNQPLAVLALIHKVTSERMAAINCGAAHAYASAVMYELASQPGSPDALCALDAQAMAFTELAHTEIALAKFEAQNPGMMARMRQLAALPELPVTDTALDDAALLAACCTLERLPFWTLTHDSTDHPGQWVACLGFGFDPTEITQNAVVGATREECETQIPLMAEGRWHFMARAQHDQPCIVGVWL